MKSKLLILSLFIWISSFAQSVPNTTTFTLQDVQSVVGYNNLTDCFTNSNADYFDPAYGSKTMSPKTLYGFRNYTVFSGVPCNADTTIAVDPSDYPEIHEVNLGSGIGTVTLTFSPGSVPDLVLVYWNGSLVINSGYIGSSAYGCGGDYRWTEFNKYLGGLDQTPAVGKVDPIYGGTYPNSNHTGCSDNYPTVTNTTQYVNSFVKSTSSNIATIYVYPSKVSSGYTFNLSCPQ